MSFTEKLKSALREVFVARPEDNNDLIWKAPSGGLFGAAVVTVRADETAVLARGGQPAGVLHPGHHLLTPELSALQLGSVAELTVSLDANLGALTDPPTGATLDCRCVASARLEVLRAGQLVGAYASASACKVNPSLTPWLEATLLAAIRAEVVAQARASRASLSEVLADGERVGAALVARCPALDAIGLRVRAFDRLELSFDADSAARLEVARRIVAPAR